MNTATKAQLTMHGVDVSAVGALLADPPRAAMLVALLGGTSLPAGDLARLAGVSRPTASSHLSMLLAAGWVLVERRGRHRYYRLASPEVAQALEHLACIAPPIPVRSLRGRLQTDALIFMRSCYDHLAGRMGVALTDALLQQDVLRVAGSDFVLTASGELFLQQRGVCVPRQPGQRRFAIRCLDWSERRDHLAGALGAAVLSTWEQQGWLRRPSGGRDLQLTPAGMAQLPNWQITLPEMPSDSTALAGPAVAH